MKDKELIKKARELQAAQRRLRISEHLNPHISDLYELMKADVSLRIMEKTINEQIGISVSHTSIGYFLKMNFPDEYNKYVHARRNSDGAVGRPKKVAGETKKASAPKGKDPTNNDHKVEPLAASEDVTTKQSLAEKEQGDEVVILTTPSNTEPTSSANSSASGAGENEGERPSLPARNRKPVNLDSVAIDMYKTTPTRM